MSTPGPSPTTNTIGKYAGEITVPAVELASDMPTWNFCAALTRRLLNTAPDPEEAAAELATGLKDE